MMLTPEDIDIAARTIWGEARGESIAGQIAVGWVIKNRCLARDRAPSIICRQPLQFSCWNIGDSNRDPMLDLSMNDRGYVDCRDSFMAAWEGHSDPTYGSRHYHVAGNKPKWARGKTPVVRIGRHCFYNDIDGLPPALAEHKMQQGA